MSAKRFCFVLMPFSEQFNDVYNIGIKDTVESIGHIAERVDDQIFRKETILERIKNQINVADFIIADMSGNNANVYYEVGFAHALQKECILIANDVSEIKFDLKHHRHIEYKSISNLKSKLLPELNQLIDDLNKKNDGLICDVAVESTDIERTSTSATGIVNFEIEISNKTDNKNYEISAIHLYSTKKWTFYQDDQPCPKSNESENGNLQKHLIRPTVSTLPAKHGWSKIKIRAKSVLGYIWDSGGLKESYDKSGVIKLKIITNSKIFEIEKRLKIICTDDIPF